MKSLFVRAILAATAITLASGALAQESTNRVAANTDWSVFEDSDPRECWGVSAPKQTVNTRDGNEVAVRRGEVLLMVFYRPGEQVQGQVAFTGGYPFAGGSTVSIAINGGDTYQMYTEGEWAWPATPEDDAALVAAMKRGAEAEVVGRSGRGTVTTDTFSLLGFTAAVDEAARRCAS